MEQIQTFFLDNIQKRYVMFEGRATRQQFWMYILFYFVFYVALAIVENLILGSAVLTLIYSLGLCLPSLSIGARRLHDTGRSGWWQLLFLIPLIGTIILIVLFALEGQQQDNEYGSIPGSESAQA
jgi:uncharacterized membrane protein YhaH (DUF805 family)